MSEDTAGAFKGTFAELYDRYLVPNEFCALCPDTGTPCRWHASS